MIVAGSFVRGFAFGKAVASTPVACDPYFNNVSLLLHMDGSNGSTTFTDNSSVPKSIFVNGSARVDTSVVKYGTGSVILDGFQDYLYAPNDTAFDFGSGNFTIEGWARATTSTFSTLKFLCGYRSATTPDNGYAVIVSTTGKLAFQIWNAGVGQSATSPTIGISANTWFHWAFVYDGTNYTMYQDGVAVISVARTILPGNSDGAFMIGRVAQELGTRDWPGYIDDVRVTKGIARYTANFTPPTAAFPNVACASTDPYYANVALLLHCDGSNGSTSFVDNSPTPKTVTPSGNAQITTSVVKYGTGSYVGDGSGDYLTVTIPGGLGAGSFTIEYWQYLISNTGFVLNSRTSGTGSDGIDLTVTAGVQTAFQQILGDYGSMPLNSWVHVAIVRDGSTWYRFFNGVLNTTTTNSNNFTGTDFKIGGSPHGNIGYMNGYLDDLRITPGVARYTSNFTPPTGPYPNS